MAKINEAAMKIDEFINTYSDDLITIHEARAAAYTHPLRGDYALADSLLDASFCRILAVFVVGSIEAMLESWRDRDEIKCLESYFANRDISNRDRITSLWRSFTDAGIQVDREVFDDYLAIKYLRNTIIHGRWKENEKVWLDARGFPTDTQMLEKDHLDKIEHVNQNMMFYIALTALTKPDSPRPAKLVRLDETMTRRKDETGILRIRDMERIIWNNLERIDAYIYSDIEKVAVSKEYDWTEGRSLPELEALGHQECKRMFYLAVRRAGEDSHERLIQHRNLAREALEFWREYRQRTLTPLEASLRPMLDVLTSVQFDPELLEWPVLANVPDDIARALIDRLLPGPLTGEQIIDALRIGKLAYDRMPNITAVTLFSVRLPLVDPENTQVYLAEAEWAIDVFRLNRAWYQCVEHRSRLNDESIAFYVDICRELGKRSHS